MQAFEFPSSCSECKGPLLDLGDELVCRGCGVVREKEVIEIAPASRTSSRRLHGNSLGSYLGSSRVTRRDRQSKVFSGSNSTYTYLKAVSDFAGREEGAAYACEKMTQRAAEKFSLPPVVVSQAVEISKKLIASKVKERGTTLAAISAFGLIAACKIEGIASVSVREIVGAYTALGRRISASALIQLSLGSPVKTVPRRPEEYVNMIITRLSMKEGFKEKLLDEGVLPETFFNALRDCAAEVLSRIEPTQKSGHRPSALAATAVYAAELVLAEREGRKRRMPQRLLAECSDSAEYTVREQYRNIFSAAVRALSQRNSASALGTSRA